MLFGAESKAVHVDTLIRAAGVGLVGLDPGEVGTFTLREAVLAVELELGNNNGVLSPTVHVKGGLGKNECSGIRDGGALVVGSVGGGQLGKAGKAKGGKNGGTVGSVSSV